MHLSPAVALLVALTPSCLALPTRTSDGQVERRWGTDRTPEADDDVSDIIGKLSSVWQAAQSCDLSSVTMPLDEAPSPSPLPSPSSGLVLSHVAVGRGTQNYTCTGQDPSATPKAVGAVATLFNVTCEAANSPDLLYETPSIALQYDIPSAESALAAYDILLSGHHYFTNSTTPFFNMDTTDHTFGTMAGKKAASATAPTTSTSKMLVADNVSGTADGNVPWLKITALDESGFAFKEVYRLTTAGGQPPDTCETETGDFTVDYAATYWFWTLPGESYETQ